MTMDKPIPSALSPRGSGRIGYLLRMYPRFSQTFVVNEILELERQGVDIRIASLRKPNEGVFHESITRVKAHADYLPETFAGYAAKHLKGQWSLLRRDPRAFARALGTTLKHKGAGWFEPMQAAQVLHWARKQRISHVHVHFGTDEATVALLAKLAGGLSYSLTLHAFDIFRDNVDKQLLAQKINASRFIVTVCESNRRYLLDKIPGVDPEKIRVNYNGIDLGRFTANGAEREPRSVFAVGRLIEKKGFIHLIHAIACLRDEGLDVVCRIAGEGRELKSLERAIKKLNLESHVHLLGSIRQDDVRRWMQQSSCFALPCVQAKDGNVDALPTVLLESLACRCPSISTRLSGVPEIIEDGESGLLVPPGNVKALAAAIRAVLTEPRRAAALADGGRCRAEERFDVGSNVAKMRHWLAEAATTSAGRTVAVSTRSSATTVSTSKVHEAA